MNLECFKYPFFFSQKWAHYWMRLQLETWRIQISYKDLNSLNIYWMPNVSYSTSHNFDCLNPLVFSLLSLKHFPLEKHYYIKSYTKSSGGYWVTNHTASISCANTVLGALHKLIHVILLETYSKKLWHKTSYWALAWVHSLHSLICDILSPTELSELTQCET